MTAAGGGSRRGRLRLLAWASLAGLGVLVCDLWNWDRVEPVLFGWMPASLWWPAGVTLLCVPVLAFATAVLWPDSDGDDGEVSRPAAGG